MGCAQSRDETRKAAFGEDMNLADYGFKATDKNGVTAHHPFGNLIAAYLGEGKEASTAAFGEVKEGKFEKADALKGGATTLFNELKALHAWANTADDSKKILGNRFTKKDVLDGLNETLTLIAGAYEDLKWPEEKPKEATDDKDGEKGKENGGEPEKEGGNEADAAAAPAGDFAANLVKAYATQPVFATLIKQQVLAADIVPDFNIWTSMNFVGNVDFTFGLAGGQPACDFKFAAAVIFFYVKAQAAKDGEVHFSARFSDEDIEELKEAAAADSGKVLVFPGVLKVFEKEEDATGKVAAASDDSKAKNQIIFKLAGAKTFEVEKEHLLTRFAATVTAPEKADDNHYTLTFVALQDTIEACTKKVEELAKK